MISAGETARGVLLSGNAGDRYSRPAPILVSLPSLTPWRVGLEKGKQMRGRRLISNEKDEFFKSKQKSSDLVIRPHTDAPGVKTAVKACCSLDFLPGPSPRVEGL